MYKAIFKSNESVNSELLLNEFYSWKDRELKQIYEKNKDWTGVCALNGMGINHLKDLPVLMRFIEYVGIENVLGINYFNLAPKSFLHPHRDMNGNLLFGVSRLHIPIKTNPKAIIEVEKIPYHLGLNEVWCLDTSGLHALKNDSNENRIHVVIDVRRCAGTIKYFPKWNLEVFLHLIKFCVIVLWKIARDSVIRPKSIISRLKELKHQRGFSL